MYAQLQQCTALVAQYGGDRPACHFVASLPDQGNKVGLWKLTIN